MASKHDAAKKTGYIQRLEGYKGQSLPIQGIPVKIRESFIDSMIHYGFDTDLISTSKISEFFIHLETKGFLDLKGRNKKSNNPQTDDSDFHQKAIFAIKHKLFYYHIGIFQYEKNGVKGDLTSEYVIHYSFDAELGYVDVICIDYHPPMQLPYEEDMQSPLMDNPFR